MPPVASARGFFRVDGFGDECGGGRGWGVPVGRGEEGGGGEKACTVGTIAKYSKSCIKLIVNVLEISRL